MNQKIIKIEGMMCKHCVAHVEKALKRLNLASVKVSLENNLAIVKNDVLDEETLRKAIEEEGYTVISIE